tara:strand:+ start:3134 stop:3445 length:312 start_codon:yes stop_codon:yes gene_type:complete
MNKNITTAESHRARMAKAEKRRAKLLPLMESLQRAGKVAEDLLHSDDPDVRLRAVHAVNQCVNTFVKIYEVGELEYRIDELTAAMAEPTRKRLIVNIGKHDAT